MSPDVSGRFPRFALAMIAIAAFVFQFAYSVSTWRDYRNQGDRVRIPLRIIQTDRVIRFVAPEMQEAGIKQGDRILAIGGIPVRGRTDAIRHINEMNLSAGDPLEVTVQTGSEPPRTTTVKLQPSAANRLNTFELTATILLEVLTRWACLLLGFFVVFVRPRDPLAWIVMGLMVSFSQVSFVPAQAVVERWPATWQAPSMFYRSLCQLSWGFWMLLFGIYFPDPKSPVRVLAWTRWAIAVPAAILALLMAIRESVSAVNLEAAANLDLVNFAGAAMLYLNMAAIGVFFANISYKAAKEPHLDSKRRLKLLFWGSFASLTPFFFVLIWSLSTGRPLFRMPPFLVLPSVALLSLFPFTLAFVLVIQRAMDLRVVIRQGLQYAFARRAVIGVQIVLSAIVIGYALGVASTEERSRPEQLITLSIAAVVVVLFGRIAGRAGAWVDKRFFREQVDAERILAELSEQVVDIHDTEALKQTVTRRISEALHVPQVTIVPGEPADNGFELALPLEVNRRRTGTLLLGMKRSEEPFTRGDIRLLKSVASQTALALENSRLTAEVAEETAQRERILREIEIAREVQQRLLPQRKPDVRGLDYCGICRPAASVGGDCYEYLVAPDGRFYLGVADVTGKGVPAALLMAGVNSALRGLVAGGVVHVDDLLTRLNRILYDSLPRNRFVTLSLASYDPATRRLMYASAGHDPILLVRANGEPEWLAARGIGLALTPAATYQEADVTLQPGDTLIFYTDGVTEARNPMGEDFGVGRLSTLVPQGSAAAMTQSLLDAVDRFSGGAPQHDDITILVARCVKEA